jgi:pimeloyl-ACP methyl ester carboxylesterase
VQVFYRTAGEANAPVVLLLHGFPASSFMFRELIPRLANDYRVIAPDLPGFGFTEVPFERKYPYSFRSIGIHDRRFHASAQDRPLRNLRVRLWRANRLPFGDDAP